MTFKDLKPGYPVYMLHKTDGIRLTTGKATVVSAPHFPQPVANNLMQTMQMVVDVTIEADGQSRTYTIPDTLAITYAGDALALATDREPMLKEIEAMKSQAEDELAKTDKRRAIVAQCEAILTEWNPAFKEKRDTEERFSKIETSMTDLKTMLSGLIKELREEGMRA